MIQKSITPARIASSILLKSEYKGSYLVVEGVNDYTLYKKFTDEEFCRVEIAHGCDRVIEVIELLNQWNYYDAIGIIDSDFKKLDNLSISNQNIFLTDDHDLEMMIIKSKALDIVVSRFANSEKLDAFVASSSKSSLREILLERASPLGFLKWANQRFNFGLTFKPSKTDGNPLPIGSFIPYKTLEFLGYEVMIREVYNYTQPKQPTTYPQSSCLTETLSIIDDALDLYQICNGHDVVTIISLALRKVIGSHNSNAISPEQVEDSLLFSYDSRFFENTQLYQSIKEWEWNKKKAIFKF